MKLIIAGSRDVHDYGLLLEAIEHFDCADSITEIVSGHAPGVDMLGERYAQENDLKLTVFPAEWDKYKKAAGPIRNEQMAKYADALIAIRKDQSKGTTDMIKRAKVHDLQIYVKDI